MTDTDIRCAVEEIDLSGFVADGSGTADDFDGPVLCVEVLQETHDVKSLRLRSPTRRQHSFLPGQHLTVSVDIHGQRLQRCYTVASSPVRSDELTITVKRVAGGPVSNWLHDHVRPGDSLSVAGPMGRFTTTAHPAEKYLFLSAGSGITPLMSMTRTIDALRTSADVLFVHCARTPVDLIFRHELRALAARNPRIRVVAVCEDDAPEERWNGLRGRLTAPVLQTIAPDLADREIFTCGPPPYMEAVRAMLAETGADPARCHEESFTFSGVSAVGAGTLVGAPVSIAQTHQVELTRSGRTIECDSDTTILLAASRAGLTLPSSCGEGLCGTCKSTMLEGSVTMDHAGGIRPREIAQNKILLCCSTPRENLVIEA